jgi:hypothetical protein
MIDFIKYNNGFTILFMLVFLATGSAFASETVRNTVVGQTIEEVEGVDNTALLALDTTNLSQKIQITNVADDVTYYYVTYEFVTFDIEENVWKDVTKKGVLKIEKRALGGTIDLGLYVQKELSQLIESQHVYLAEVQKKEKTTGVTKRVKKTMYSGLKGLVLDDETKEFEGYSPTIRPFVIKDTPYTPQNNVDISMITNEAQRSTTVVVPSANTTTGTSGSGEVSTGTTDTAPVSAPVSDTTSTNTTTTIVGTTSDTPTVAPVTEPVLAPVPVVEPTPTVTEPTPTPTPTSEPSPTPTDPVI